MPATTAHPSKRTLRVDGARVDKAIQEIRAAFDAGDGSHLDPRNWQDSAASSLADRWRVTYGSAPVWDAADALLTLEGSLARHGMQEYLVDLIVAVDEALAEYTREHHEGSSEVVLKVDAAYRAVGAAITSWKAEVA
jgi:hypothetical protein